MLGNKHYVVVMPSLTKQFFVQRPTTLSSDSFLHYILDKYFGDGGAASRLRGGDTHAIHSTLNALLREPTLSGLSTKTQTLLEEETPRLMTFISEMNKTKGENTNANVMRLGEDSMEVDLYPLVSGYVAEVAGISLMGRAFFENNPGIFKDLWVFDNAFHSFLVGVPAITSGLRKARASRNRLNTAMKEWNYAVLAKLEGRDPGKEWGDLSDVSAVMGPRIKKMMVELKTDDIVSTTMNVALYWGLMVNSNKLIFWMLLHVISSPDLLEGIRKEIDPFIQCSFNQKNPSLKIQVDDLFHSCPLLKATFYETMRLYTVGTSYKKVLQDLTLTESAEDAAKFGKERPQTYHVRAGTYLVIPHGTMQSDPRLWENPMHFEPKRFLVPDEEKPEILKASMRHLNPFGGGTSMCKGRFYAEREVLLHVASLVAVWEFTPKGKGTSWKVPERAFNGTGSAHPKVSVRVRISPRSL